MRIFREAIRVAPLFVAVALTLSMSLVGRTERAQAAFPGADGLIAFESNRDAPARDPSRFDIYVMNADGSAQTRLTTFGAGDPSWSPDGSKIVFDTARDGNAEIYVMSADGSNPTRLTFRPGATDIFPSWSPDGSKIVFASYSFTTFNYDIWVMNADGSDQVNLTNNPAEDIFPTWQPGGSRIAFQTDRDGNREIYSMASDGSDPVDLTRNPGEDEIPDWSPDGSKLVFDSTRANPYSPDIYVMNADGSGVIRLTTTRSDRYAAWSPDGSKIAFTSRRDFNDEIYVMNADGSNPIRLTNNAPPGNDLPQDWFPDWQRIAPPPPTDTTPPSISANVSGPLGTNGWYTGDVTVAWTTADPESGISTTSGCASTTISVDTAGVTLTCAATNGAGIAASKSITVERDATPPTISANTDRSPNLEGWFNAPVEVGFDCSDALSGVASCSDTITVGEGEDQSVTGTATDNAGNTVEVTLTNLDVDTTAPHVTYTGNAGAYGVDQTIDITCVATDSLSGVASSTCSNISGPAYSFGLGTTIRSATATDRAGNTGTGSTTFTVSVTPASLTNLITQFFGGDTNGANGLIAKVNAITSAPNANAKSGALGAFDNQIDAKVGNPLTAAQATILEQLVAAL